MYEQRDGYPPPPSLDGGFRPSRRQQSGQPHPPPLVTTVFNRSHTSQPNSSLPGSAVGTPPSPMFPLSSVSVPSAPPPSMAPRTYNPRQWSQSGYAGGSRTSSGPPSRGSTRESTGMEASMPSPPPPYTPPASINPQRLGRPPVFGNDSHAPSPLVNSFPSAVQGQSSSRSSPQVQQHAQFPPPPSKDKGPARAERESSRPRFSLQALTAMVKRPDHMELPSQPNSPMIPPTDYFQGPPAGRRAISAGGINYQAVSGPASEGPSSGRPSPESGRWEPGMPLPPPPPGPPPPISGRSHSLNRFAQPRQTGALAEMPVNVRPSAPARTSHSNTLGAVPPTPVGWVEDDPIPDVQSQIQMFANDAERHSVNLTRRPATRDPSADSILERRSRSKANRDYSVGREISRADSQTLPAAPGTTFRKPANLVLSSTDPLLQRRLAERTVRSEDSNSPESARHHHQLTSSMAASTLTPPYTPSPEMRRKIAMQSALDGEASSSTVSGQDGFVQASLERFHMFIQQEASSPTDRDRLELFANFMVHESRIRRDRYSKAFSSMAGEIMELTRDMWRPLGSSPGSVKDSQSVNDASHEILRPLKSPSINPPTSSCSSATEFTPATDTESVCDNSDHCEDRPPPTPWGERFQPSLSPIRSVPSMAISTAPDEESSRGRPPSRWWEGSGEGSVGQGNQRLGMTKQESKYMSLNPNELILAAQPSPSGSTPTPGTTNTSFKYGPDEYPTEKTESHQSHAAQEYARPEPSTTSVAKISSYWSEQPRVRPMDISRLVTLPPPFPRHYPALQNNHPSLSEIRSRHRETARMISVRQGRPQSDDSWQPSVYNDIMQTCESSIAELARRLGEASDNQQATAAQTEGDERPELLEQLTLLKWIFETREQLQKQDFDAAMQQLKARYQATIEACRYTGDYQRQMAEEDRMAAQLQQNQAYFAEHASQRFRQLLEIVERHVSRGVEAQLSAFWDIAPGLLEVVQKIPAQDTHSLAAFSIMIPDREIQDNPSYSSFPLQYLLHTLTHAKKSAYQFIESQTNLLCLLHEVRTAAISAELRLVEMRSVMKGESPDRARQEMMQVRVQREEEETSLLKERVGCLEGQWESALGEEIEKVVEKVEQLLHDQGGWEEGMGV